MVVVTGSLGVWFCLTTGVYDDMGGWSAVVRAEGT
jgi:hypothetical protein